MIKHFIILKAIAVLLLIGGKAVAQAGRENFGKVWMQGQSLVYTTAFNGSQAPDNQIAFPQQVLPPYLSLGHSNICDSSGNILLVSDGFNLYDRNLAYIDGGHFLVPPLIYNHDLGSSSYSQASILLPFSDNKYRLITPTVSDEYFMDNWTQPGTGKLVVFDQILYNEIDMSANGGAGKVTKRMEPMLQDALLSKTQMMACRHADGKSWWLLKQASDTNMVYKFLLTDDRIYGPYIQGFTGAAAKLGLWDIHGQSMFSQDGTKYATTILGYNRVFVADFDRCTGNLFNPKVYKMPAQIAGNPWLPSQADSTTSGLCFSPNGRYLYVSGLFQVQQLDLQNPSSPSAWTQLAGMDTTWEEFQLYLTIYPGADGKLYIGNRNGFSGQMSVIDNPDSKGAAAGFCRKCLRFPGHLVDTVTRFAGVSEPPCMPNYALGPTNPICYPLGVESPAKMVQFNLYPNPAIGNLNVSFSAAGHLEISDIMGRLIRTVSLPASAGGKLSVGTADLPAGIVVCRYFVNGALQEVRKITVLHE